MTDPLFIALIGAAGLGAGLLWIWRFWALRTWRTLALFGFGALMAAIALRWEPYGEFIALVMVGVVLWLAGIGARPLMSIAAEEYDYAERLRRTDEEVRRIFTDRRTGNASPEAIASLDKIISALSEPTPHAAWEPVRAAKVEELTLARDILSKGVTESDALEDLRAIRANAVRAVLDVRRARSSFWGA
jgi:hypothetical protein